METPTAILLIVHKKHLYLLPILCCTCLLTQAEMWSSELLSWQISIISSEAYGINSVRRLLHLLLYTYPAINQNKIAHLLKQIDCLGTDLFFVAIFQVIPVLFQNIIRFFNSPSASYHTDD